MSDIDEVLDVGGFHVKQWISSEQSDVKENPSEVTIGGKSQVEKVLGAVWLPQTCLCLKSNLNWLKKTFLWEIQARLSS